VKEEAGDPAAKDAEKINSAPSLLCLYRPALLPHAREQAVMAESAGVKYNC